MASWGGHTLPGTFFIIFGIFYAFKFTRSYLKRSQDNGKKSVFYCCRGRLPCSGIVIEGVVKVVFISIGILVELFYPGAPMGHLHEPNGDLTHPMNWQHATMYFFFGLSGLADIISYTAHHVVPAGFDRLFGSLALFIEGYLFFFHLHGRSNIDTRVHILLVLAVWPGALVAFLQCFVMHKRKLLHIFEMLTSALLIMQGTWFWQVEDLFTQEVLVGGFPKRFIFLTSTSSFSFNFGLPVNIVIPAVSIDCNSLPQAELNLMFITMFWSWHAAAAICFVGAVYFIMYKYLKFRGTLDPSFSRGYDSISGSEKYNSTTPLTNGISLLADDEEEDEI